MRKEIIKYLVGDDYAEEDDPSRICEICGGEFWDGGTSCTCEVDNIGG